MENEYYWMGTIITMTSRRRRASWEIRPTTRAIMDRLDNKWERETIDVGPFRSALALRPSPRYPVVAPSHSRPSSYPIIPEITISATNRIETSSGRTRNGATATASLRWIRTALSRKRRASSRPHRQINPRQPLPLQPRRPHDTSSNLRLLLASCRHTPAKNRISKPLPPRRIHFLLSTIDVILPISISSLHHRIWRASRSSTRASGSEWECIWRIEEVGCETVSGTRRRVWRLVSEEVGRVSKVLPLRWKYCADWEKELMLCSSHFRVFRSES